VDQPNSRYQSVRSRPQVGRKIVAAGIFAGAAVGVWAANKLRSMPELVDSDTRLIDWEKSRSIAVNMNRAAALTAPERERLDTYYRDLVERSMPVVSNYVGIAVPTSKLQTFAFDRVDWINANVEAFKQILGPLEALVPDANGHRTAAGSLLSGANRRIMSAEVALLLGYLARRVLGQYDIALLGREPMESGKLYFVEPNIAAVERNLKLPADEFRIWLALHETTHVFEFEGFPWVRSYFNEMLERYFEYLKADAQELGKGIRNLKIFVDRIRSSDKSTSSLIESLMNEEQRSLFNRMQAMMCVVEGYSNHVMNAVGRDLLSDYDSISRKFEHRQQHRSYAEQLFARLTGLDMKIEQYRQGQRFVDEIVQTHGHDFALMVWDRPENLPSLDEIKDPQSWVRRVNGTARTGPINA
jgi:coenzyme F420 biosynthesis associated uncharacterized protein